MIKVWMMRCFRQKDKKIFLQLLLLVGLFFFLFEQRQVGISGWGDSDELVLSGYRLAIPHPPGYPVLVFLVFVFKSAYPALVGTLLIGTCWLILGELVHESKIKVNLSSKFFDPQIIWEFGLLTSALVFNPLIWPHLIRTEIFSITIVMGLIFVYGLLKNNQAIITLCLISIVSIGQWIWIGVAPMLLWRWWRVMKERNKWKTVIMQVGTDLLAIGLGFGLWILLMSILYQLSSNFSWKLDWSWLGMYKFWTRADFSGFISGYGLKSAWLGEVLISVRGLLRYFEVVKSIWWWQMMGILLGGLWLLKCRKMNYQMGGFLLASMTFLLIVSPAVGESDTLRLSGLMIFDRFLIWPTVGLVLVGLGGWFELWQQRSRYLIPTLVVGIFSILNIATNVNNLLTNKIRLADYYIKGVLDDVGEADTVVCLSDISCFGLMYAQGVLGIKPKVKIFSQAPQLMYKFNKQIWTLPYYYEDNPERLGLLISETLNSGHRVFVTEMSGYWANQLGLQGEAFVLCPKDFSFELSRSSCPLNQSSIDKEELIKVDNFLNLAITNQQSSENKVITQLMIDHFVTTGYLYADRGNFEVSQKYFETLLKILPENKTINLTYDLAKHLLPKANYGEMPKNAEKFALEFANSGNVAETIRFWRFVAWQDLNNYMARLELAKWFENINLMEFAKREYQTILKIDPSVEVAKDWIHNHDKIKDLGDLE